jgi:hypothetical protein
LRLPNCRFFRETVHKIALTETHVNTEFFLAMQRQPAIVRITPPWDCNDAAI